MQLFEVFGRIGVRADEFNRGVDDAEKRGSGFAAKLGKSLAKVGAAFAVIGAAALRTGMDFDSSLRAIQAQTGQTADDLSVTEKAVRNLALEQGRFSANELISGLESVSRHGQDSEHQLMMINSAMRLADSTGQDFGKAIKNLDDLMVKFGKETLEGATQFTNMFATAQGVAGVAMSSLTDGMQRAAGITNMAGLAYDFVAGSLTRAYQEGMSMQVAATGLTNIFSDMTDVTSNMRAVMDDLGIQIGINDDGSRDYQGALSDLTAALRGLDYDTRQATMAQLGLTGGALTLFDIFKNNYQYVDNLSEAFRDGIEAGDQYWRVMEMIDARTGGVGEQLGRFRNILTEVKLSLFGVIEVPFGQTMGRFNDAITRLARVAIPILQTGLRAMINVLGVVLNVFTRLMPVIITATAALVAFKAAVAIQATIAKATTAIKALRAGLALFSAAAKMGTINMAAFGTTSKALGVIMGVLTGKIKLATAAQIAKNIAMKANPIGLVIAGVAALAVGMAYLATRTGEQTEEQKALKAETIRLREETDALTSSVRESAAAHDRRIASYLNEATAANDLIDRIEELSSKTNLTATEKAQLEGYVRMLNQALGEEAIALNRLTGEMSKSISEMRELANARLKQLEVQAMEERYIELLQKRAEATDTATAATNAFNSANIGNRQIIENSIALYREGIISQEELGSQLAANVRASGMSKEALISLVYAYVTTEEVVQSLTQQIEEQGDVMVEHATTVAEATETIEESFYSLSMSAEELQERFESAMGLIADKVDSAVERMTNGFNTLNNDVSLDLAEIAANTETNMQLVSEQLENTGKVMQRAIALGVDDFVLAKFEEMANRGPGYAAMLANDTTGEFERLAELWGSATSLAVDGVADAIGLDADVVQAAHDLGSSAADSLRSQLDGAGILEMGANVAQSLADGMNRENRTVGDAASEMGLTVDEFARKVLGIASPSTVFTDHGENIGTSFGDGIISRTPYATDASDDMATQTVEAAENVFTYSAFLDIAQEGINGWVSGIENGTNSVVAAITAVANAAVAAANAALQISSPSRIFTAMGENVINSFVNAIKTRSSAIEKVMADTFGSLDKDVEIGVSSGFSSQKMATAMVAPSGGDGGDNIIINQKFDTVVMSPYEVKQQTLAGMRRLRWAR